MKDTEPKATRTPHSIITALVVDEDGLPNGVGNTDSPNDDDEDYTPPNAGVDDAKHFGTIPFTPGADPTSIELTVLGGPETSLKTLANQKVLAPGIRHFEGSDRLRRGHRPERRGEPGLQDDHHRRADRRLTRSSCCSR